MRLAAQGLPLVCVNPAVTFGAGDVHVTSTRLVRSFLLGRVPVYADGAICVVDVDDVARGPPAGRRARARWASATSSAAATSPSTACSPTSAGCPASSRRCRLPALAAPARPPALLGAGPDRPLRGARGHPVVDLPQHQGQARARLAGAPARGDARGHRAAGTWSASTTASRAPAARSSSSTARPAPPSARSRRAGARRSGAGWGRSAP